MSLGRKKRGKTQLLLETGIVAALVILVVSGGNLATLNVPAPWANIQNPANINQQQDQLSLASLAAFFNITLSEIGTANFSLASFSLNNFGLLNIPSNVLDTATNGNSELTNINISAPIALNYLNATIEPLREGNLTQAQNLAAIGCEQAYFADHNFTNFESSTTPALGSLQVPTSNYTIGAMLTKLELNSIIAQCKNTQSKISELLSSNNNVNFTISSQGKSIVTGGNITINGNLARNGTGLANQNITFYFKGYGNLGSFFTSSDGTISATLKIPFVYVSSGIIYAYAASNSTIGFPGQASNLLNFTILFNGTQIIIQDPPSYLPTQSLDVHGTLNSPFGPLPGASIKITFFGTSYYNTTDSRGRFSYMLTVPSNATDGTHYVYAAFFAQGAFGPSRNFTSIQVYHEPLVILVSPAGYSFAGLSSSSISGRVYSNGTSLDNASVSISSPWGVFPATTNSTGGFFLNLPVPIWVFSLSQGVSASVYPKEPYIASGSAGFQIPIFNFLLVLLPAVGLFVGYYEIRTLGLVSRLRRLKLRRREKSIEIMEQAEESVDQVLKDFLPKEEYVQRKEPVFQFKSKIVQIYRDALLLATVKFGLKIRESMTLREIEEMVKGFDPRESVAFILISRNLEDYLYAPVFSEDSALPKDEEALSRLKAFWGNQKQG